MKLLTCIFKMLLVAYIFVSSVTILRNYVKGDLALSNWGNEIRLLVLRQINHQFMKNAIAFFQSNFQNFLATLVFMSFFGLFFSQITSMVAFCLIVIQAFSINIKSVQQLLEPKTLQTFNQIISYVIVMSISCAMTHCKKKCPSGPCPRS